MDLFAKCASFSRAKEVRAAGLYPYFIPLDDTEGTEVVINGKRMIMIGSNNYLGLATHPKVREAAIEATRHFGTSCTGSRFLNGNLAMHEQLEHELAEFVGTEAGLVFSTGMQTNLGTISALVGRGDVVITDREDHASIVDGCRLSFGKMYKYKHNDMDDLERLLKAQGNNSGGKLIVSDGVFSMEGDIVDLPKISSLAKKYDARLMIDDAHSCGVLGKYGRGTGEHFNLENDIDLTMGTFSKSFASLGGFIAGDKKVIEFIKHNARSLIFSASMPPSAVATVNTALDILKAEPERIDQLWKNTKKMKKAFDSMGFNTGTTQTPIIPIIIGEDMHTFGFWKLLFEHGIFSNPVVSFRPKLSH